MIEYISEKQLSIKEFKTPFDTALSIDNRWVKLSSIVPWDTFAKLYISLMDSSQGRPGISPRIVLGALIIKHKENLSDEKVIQEIQENIYMQFFVGLKAFQTKKIFDPSLFVTIRKRIGKNEFDKLNIELIKSLSNQVDKKNSSKKPDSDEHPPNKGALQADATVADQYITFPTDSKLLNTSRKKLDIMIDKLHQFSDKSSKKPRTYKRVLDQNFLAYSKKRRKGRKIHRQMVRIMLESVNRNINFVTKMLKEFSDFNFGKEPPITQKDLELLSVIKLLYAQQKQMYDANSNTIKNRIVSIFQPHVRPILRGKEKSRVEFGSKLGVSLDNGFARINTFSWNAYHEGKDLILQVTSYFDIHGYYPELVLVDKAYHTRENRLWLSEKGIRITAEPLGRKPKQKPTPYQKAKRKKEYAERNHIEGKFGQGKNGYNLNKIRAKLKETSESWVSCIFFVMNLINHQRKSSLAQFLRSFFTFKNRLYISIKNKKQNVIFTMFFMRKIA